MESKHFQRMAADFSYFRRSRHLSDGSDGFGKNNSKNSRTATVNLVSAGLTQSFTVTQSPAEYVELEQTAYYTEAQGGSLQIKFTTNLSTDELAIYGTASWLTQPANSRTDQAYVVNLTVLPNEEEKERTAYLYFCKTNGEEEEILNSVTIIRGRYRDQHVHRLLSRQDRTNSSACHTGKRTPYRTDGRWISGH